MQEFFSALAFHNCFVVMQGNTPFFVAFTVLFM